MKEVLAKSFLARGEETFLRGNGVRACEGGCLTGANRGARHCFVITREFILPFTSK